MMATALLPDPRIQATGPRGAAFFSDSFAFLYGRALQDPAVLADPAAATDVRTPEAGETPHNAESTGNPEPLEDGPPSIAAPGFEDMRPVLRIGEWFERSGSLPDLHDLDAAHADFLRDGADINKFSIPVRIHAEGSSGSADTAQHSELNWVSGDLTAQSDTPFAPLPDVVPGRNSDWSDAGVALYQPPEDGSLSIVPAWSSDVSRGNWRDVEGVPGEALSSPPSGRIYAVRRSDSDRAPAPQLPAVNLQPGLTGGLSDYRGTGDPSIRMPPPRVETAVVTWLAAGPLRDLIPDSGAGIVSWMAQYSGDEGPAGDAGGELRLPGLAPSTFSGPAENVLPPRDTGHGNPNRPVSAPAAQLVEAILSAGPGRISVLLQPDDLGAVRVNIMQEGDSLRVHLQADRPELQELLRRYAHELGAELAGAGHGAVSFSFGDAPGGEEGERPSTDTAVDPPPVIAPVSLDLSSSATRLDLRL